MIRLSYSSLKYLNGNATHEWVNKQMGIPVPKYPFLQEGKDAHRIIQDHVSKKNKDKRLSHIRITFPVVEEREFDPRCRFIIPLSGGYEVTGFYDGRDDERGRFLEIKTSSSPWTLRKFSESIQRKIYALAHPDFTKAYLITGSKDPKVWESAPPKLYAVTLTQRDRDDAWAWIANGIAVLEKGDFTGGLDEHGKCTGCFWNMDRYRDIANCHFM